MEKDIYLVLSQTGSWLSGAIKIVTGNEFNHVSISLSPDLEPMYSFGRRQPFNPFWGGFVKEHINEGTFFRFPKTSCEVLRLSVPQDVYDRLGVFLEEMYLNKERYGYNFVGLFLASMNISRPRTEKFYCSEFVKALFTDFKIQGASTLSEIVHPVDFKKFPGIESIYRGLLRDFEGQAISDAYLKKA